MFYSYKEDTIEYDIKYSNRKSIAIQLVGPFKVLLKGPKVQFSVFEKILMDKWSWIIENSQKFQSQKQPRAYENGDVFNILGKRFKVKVQEHKLARADISMVEDELLFYVPFNSPPEVFEQLMEGILRKVLKEFLNWRIPHFQKHFNKRVNNISVRNQKTRWGSCSSAGNLSFNYRLALAPLDVVDYIIVHEMSHLEHLNHSKSYWKKVHQVMPDYKKHDKWLKDYGHTLRITIMEGL